MKYVPVVVGLGWDPADVNAEDRLALIYEQHSCPAGFYYVIWDHEFNVPLRLDRALLKASELSQKAADDSWPFGRSGSVHE